MTKDELEKEAEEWLNKWYLCNKCENKVDCISNFSYCKKVVLQSYLASAEPREKQISELEMTVGTLRTFSNEQATCIERLKAQIEKMKWHKVGDGDIPKNERWVCNQDGCYCYYDIDTEQWLDVEGTRTKTIEWCDMPTKEIKEK